jgi:hypothetical protein
MFDSISGGIGGLKFKGAGVVSGALGVAFDYMLKDNGPGATELSVAYANARDSLTKRFNTIITHIQQSEVDVAADWGKLKQMGQTLSANGGANGWPKPDNELRDEAGRLMEISLWKDLLRVKWHHMTSSNDPTFTTRYSEDKARGMEAAHNNYWIEWKAGKGTVGFKQEDGFYVTEHWLGYGNHWTTHHQPAWAMGDRLFSSRLKLSRKEVFTDSSWNLSSERLWVQN